MGHKCRKVSIDFYFSAVMYCLLKKKIEVYLKNICLRGLFGLYGMFSPVVFSSANIFYPEILTSLFFHTFRCTKLKVIRAYFFLKWNYLL